MKPTYVAQRAMSIQSWVDTGIMSLFISFSIGTVHILLILFGFCHIMYNIFINMLCAFMNGLLSDSGGGMNLFELATGLYSNIMLRKCMC